MAGLAAGCAVTPIADPSTAQAPRLPPPEVIALMGAQPSPDLVVDHRAILRPGDEVIATGAMIVGPDGSTLCRVDPKQLLIGYLPGSEPPPDCSDLAIELVDVDLEGVTGLSQRGQLTYGGNITVTGRWNGTGINVEGVQLAPGGEPRIAPLSATCRMPARGWPDPGREIDAEVASAALGRQILAHPETYSGLWVSELEGVGDVLFVGTIDDPAEVYDKLARVSRYPLCVVRVSRSRSDLEAIAAELSSPDGKMITEIVTERDQVRVRVPFVDETVLSTLKPFGTSVFITPLVQAR